MAKRRVVIETRYCVGIETEQENGTLSLDERETAWDHDEAIEEANKLAAEERLDVEDRT